MHADESGAGPCDREQADEPDAGRRGRQADEHRPRNRRAAGRHVSPIRVIRRPGAVAVAIAGLVVACCAVAGLAWASHTGRSAVTPRGAPPLVPVPAGKRAAVPSASATTVPGPTALVIPAIGVRTRLIHLGLTSNGTLQVPAIAVLAGWYTGSPRPGEPGPAVIAGHIDSSRGPGVFFRLRDLRPGNLVYVRRGRRSLAVFTVMAVRTYPRWRFPASAIYGPEPNAQLRLITCGGTFDPATRHYLSNVIVFAVLKP